MKKQVRRISVHQSSKVIAAMYAAMTTVIVFLPIAIHQLVWGHIGRVIFFIVILPLLYWLILYISHAIGFWFYNLAARSLGGIEFDLVDLDRSEHIIHPDEIDRTST